MDGRHLCAGECMLIHRGTGMWGERKRAEIQVLSRENVLYYLTPQHKVDIVITSCLK